MSIKSNEFIKDISGEKELIFRLAIVTDIVDQKIFITFYGEEIQSGKNYKYLESYNPVIGDVVCVARINESWLVLGKVTDQRINNDMYYLENTSSGSSMRLSLIYYNDTALNHVFRASSGNLVDIGSANYKFRNIYANNGTIQTSDLREKEEIQSLNESHIELFRKLLPKSYKFINGTSGRRHIGFVSQDIEEALKECNMTDMDFAGFIKSPVFEVVDGEETKNIIDHIYGLRYDEFIGILAFVLQDVISFVEKLGYRGEGVSKNEDT